MIPIDESFSIVVSLIGLAMAPFWAKWWAAGTAEWTIPIAARSTLVIALSVATLLITYAGPWFAMMVTHGVVEQNVTDPNFPFILLLFFGPGVAWQMFISYLACRAHSPLSDTPPARVGRISRIVVRMRYSVDKDGLERWLMWCLRAWMCAGLSVIAIDAILFDGLRENDTRAPVQLAVIGVFVVVAAIGAVGFVRCDRGQGE